MMHTGFFSQIKKSEVGNLKILLEILGCCPEMGFSINKMNENSNHDQNQNDSEQELKSNILSTCDTFLRQ